MTIRRQLLLGLLGGALACTLLAGAATYWKVREEADELFDYELRTLAMLVPVRGGQVAPAAMQGDPEESAVVQLWDRRGHLVHASAPRPLPLAAAIGYGEVVARGEPWRVYVAVREGALVQVAQAQSARRRLAAGVALRSLLPFMAMIPVLALLIWWVVGRGLRPLGAMTAALARQSPGALQPLASAGAPSELLPVIAAVNDLLQRLDKALRGQRAFIADAAHELRSPLAALKLQLQLAERADDAARRAAAFARLRERIERSIHLVQQMLVAARQDSLPRDRPCGPVDLLELAQACVADHFLAACTRRIDLGIPVRAARIAVAGRADELRILLDNLLANAVRYTPPGGRIDVMIDDGRDGPVLQVCDDGPGIPEADRERVFDRFYRGAAHEEWGSGLGLSIVAGIAAGHGATVSLEDNPAGYGLCVTVRFGAA